jgi:hypothetical protein
VPGCRYQIRAIRPLKTNPSRAFVLERPPFLSVTPVAASLAPETRHLKPVFPPPRCESWHKLRHADDGLGRLLPIGCVGRYLAIGGGVIIPW